MIRNTTQRDFKLKYVVLKLIDLFGESCYFIIINELMILLKKEKYSMSIKKVKYIFNESNMIIFNYL